MSRRVDVGDLIDAQEVSELVGLSHRNSVSLYQRRYPDMPRPVVDLGSGRTKLWLRSDVQRWHERRKKTRRVGWETAARSRLDQRRRLRPSPG